MRLSLAPRKTSRELGHRLAALLTIGTLRDVLDELALPTWPADPLSFPIKPSRDPLSILDSSTGDGTLLLGYAATVPGRAVPFRLACFAILLERGANPWGRGEDGRLIGWTLDAAEPEVKSWCMCELSHARKAWRELRRYEAPVDVKDWICRELAALEGGPAPREQAREEDTGLPNPPVNLHTELPLQKRSREASPLPDYEDEPPVPKRPKQSLLDSWHEVHKRTQESSNRRSDPPENTKHMTATSLPPPVQTPSGLTEREKQSFLDSLHAVFKHAQQPSTRCSDSPNNTKDTTATSLSPPVQTPSGLTEREAYLFAPLIVTLRKIGADVVPRNSCQVGQVLRKHYPDVYTRDPEFKAWKAYSQRASALGIVQLEPAGPSSSLVSLNPEYATRKSSLTTK